MELAYRIDWPDDTPGSEIRLGHHGAIVSAWSSSNLLAFTTEKYCKGYLEQYLNILNPNQPWDAFSVVYKSGGQITCMEWDHTGTQLLTGDSCGHCSVWVMTNMMSNLWQIKTRHSDCLQGEEILAVGWLHHGIRVLFHIEKLDQNTNGVSKFDRSKFKPSLIQFGGKPVTGYVAVTGSGKVLFKVFKHGTDTVKLCQLNISCHQEIADIAFTCQGKIAILLSDGYINHMLQFFEIQLKYDSEDKIGFEVNALPNLPLQCASDDETPYTFVSHAKFVSRENQDHVLVCVSGPTGSRLESWLLRKKDVKLHRVFQQSTVAFPTEVTTKWQFVKHSEHLLRVKNLSVPSFSIDTSSTETLIAQEMLFHCGQGIGVAMADSTIQILHRIYLKPLVIQHLPETAAGNPLEASSAKRMKPHPSCLQRVIFSNTSCALAALDDRGSMLMYRVPPWLNHPGRAQTPQALHQIVQLLIYCLVCGCEWWDVLLHVQPQAVDVVIEKLCSEMSKQPEALQQILRSKLLAMKITIFHVGFSSQSMDCHLKLMFDAIALVFRSLVRPHQQVTAEEKDPAIQLQGISCTSMESDIDKLVHNIDTDPQTLQSMQQLIQWIADVALYLLASVPLYKQTNRPGVTLLLDSDWLAVLREMLVLIRVWGLLKSACMPLFCVLDSRQDVVSHIFRLVTLLWQASLNDGGGGGGKELPIGLINECSVLPMQVLIPPLRTIAPPNGVLHHRRSNNSAFRLEYGRAMPDAEMGAKRTHKMDHVQPADSKVDVLRWISLGKTPGQHMKECSRCGITTLYSNMQRSPMRVWDQRFTRSCLCGGHWRRVSPRDMPIT